MTNESPLCKHMASGCLVAPGFDFEDFEIVCKQHFLASYLQDSDIIETLSR
jgi:predicted cupin superfamily sugar epimerase